MIARVLILSALLGVSFQGIHAQEVSISPGDVSLSTPVMEDYRTGWIQESLSISVIDWPEDYEIRMGRTTAAQEPIDEIQVSTVDTPGWITIPPEVGHDVAPVIFDLRSTNLDEAAIDIRVILDLESVPPEQYGGLLEVFLVTPNP